MLPLLQRTIALGLLGNIIHILSSIGYYYPVCMIWTYSGVGYCCTDKSYMYRYWILSHSESQGQIDECNSNHVGLNSLAKRHKKRLPGFKGLLGSSDNILS